MPIVESCDPAVTSLGGRGEHENQLEPQQVSQNETGQHIDITACVPDPPWTTAAMPPELTETNPWNAFRDMKPHCGNPNVSGQLGHYGNHARIDPGKTLAQTGSDYLQFGRVHRDIHSRSSAIPCRLVNCSRNRGIDGGPTGRPAIIIPMGFLFLFSELPNIPVSVVQRSGAVGL